MTVFTAALVLISVSGIYRHFIFARYLLRYLPLHQHRAFLCALLIYVCPVQNPLSGMHELTGLQ